MKSIITKGGIAIAALAIAFVGCRKEFDEPPVQTIPDGNYLTIAQLRDSIDAYNSWSVDKDYNLLAVVTMDESTGNIYKEVYIKDNTGAINMRLLSGGGLYEGDSIRINLNGTYLSRYNQMAQIDSVDVDANVVKQATQVPVEPITVTIDQIDPSMQAQLVRIENVEFIGDDVGSTYADAENQQSVNKTLTDCNNNTILVRNSGYADFAADTIPEGNGTFIGVVGQFNTDMQLYIRDPQELTLNGTRCTSGGGGGGSTYLEKDFNDGSITSGGWLNYLVSGTANCEWEIFGTSDQVAKVTNWDGSSNTACETWLISPAIDLSGSTNPVLNFRNTYRYNGDPLELYISTDYDGSSDPSVQGTWTALSATWDTDGGSWSFVDGGPVDLSSYKQAGVYIGFKYIGSSSDGSTWELDNIYVEEN